MPGRGGVPLDWKILQGDAKLRFQIYSRGKNLYGLMVYLVLVFLQFYIVNCLIRNVSCLDQQYLWLFLRKWFPLMILGFIALISVYQVRKSSFFWCVFYLGLTALLSILPLFQRFDKLILFICFFEILCSYIFVNIWVEEMKDPCFVANFDLHDLNLSSLIPLEALVEFEGGVQEKGLLTNWSEKSCFFKLATSKRLKDRSCCVSVRFDGILFKQRALIKTKSLLGLGLDLGFEGAATKDSDQDKGWHELYSLLSERAYLPEYLKG